jgi:putative transposase
MARVGLDSIFIERLWRSLKYECIYLHAFEGGAETRAGIGKWIGFYNRDRPHTAHGGHTPEEYYYGYLSRSGPGLRPSPLATNAIAGIINMEHRPEGMIIT